MTTPWPAEIAEKEVLVRAEGLDAASLHRSTLAPEQKWTATSRKPEQSNLAGTTRCHVTNSQHKKTNLPRGPTHTKLHPS